jgi:hypothetical protein
MTGIVIAYAPKTGTAGDAVKSNRRSFDSGRHGGLRSG